MGKEGTYFKIKAIYDKPTANIILKSEKLKSFPLRLGKRQGCTFLPFLFNIVSEVLAYSIGSPSLTAIRQEIKGNQIGKEEVKLFVDDMTLYIENPRNATRKLLELSEFAKVTGYKINIQKSAAFIYTTNKLSEREIKETIPFTITSKKNK